MLVHQGEIVQSGHYTAVVKDHDQCRYNGADIFGKTAVAYSLYSKIQ